MKQILTRLALTLPVVWLVVSLVFLLIHLVPGDPVQMMLGEGASPADTKALRHDIGLDLPLPQQYMHYWAGVVHGDLGSSIRLHDTVAHLIAARYPYTLALTLTALGFGLSLALPAGILAAVRRGDQVRHRVVQPDRAAQIAVHDARPIVHVLLRQRQVEANIVA